MMKRALLPLPFLAALLLGGCSINKMAMRAVSDALTGQGSGDVFTGDSDPELVGDALPFAIKMYESLLSASPDHQGLILTTGSLFVMYANAFVQNPAECLPQEQYEERYAQMDRAKQFYLRGVAILHSGLERKYPGFKAATVKDGTLEPILKKCKKEDVGILYWTVAGELAAYSINVFDFDLGARIPELSAMIKRAYELDPDYDTAALDEFYILFYASLPEVLGGDKELAKLHYQRALEKTGGASTGAYVSYAQSICIPAQDYDVFKDNLEKALAVDVNADKSKRLVNILNQRKARFLLDTAYDYFSFLPVPGMDGEDY
ncbi:MAG: TRAP transporter TatT component family protein [Treponema sp.]|jgi:tetratricopeptide (TPR) repeat protein|nr:TRAP transporter TatT component family protein [Treponema sp.]